VVRVREHLERRSTVDRDIVSLAQQEHGRCGPEHNGDSGRQNASAHGMALPGFLRNRVAQRNPLIIGRLHPIDRKIQFAGTPEAPFFLGLRDRARHARAFGDHDRVAGLDGVGYGQFHDLALFGGRRRNVLVEPHAHFGSFRQHDLRGTAKNGQQNKSHTLSHGFLQDRRMADLFDLKKRRHRQTMSIPPMKGRAS